MGYSQTQNDSDKCEKCSGRSFCKGSCTVRCDICGKGYEKTSNGRISITDKGIDGFINTSIACNCDHGVRISQRFNQSKLAEVTITEIEKNAVKDKWGFKWVGLSKNREGEFVINTANPTYWLPLDR